MRLTVVSAIVVVALAAPAMACPPVDACLVSLRSTVRTPSAPYRIEPTGAIASVTSSLQLPLLASTKRAPGEVEVPWIWRVLREQVYSRMPTYRDKDELSFTLAPVVVQSPTDTVPGLGIAGDF